MSKNQPLKLSDLRSSVDYPVVGPPPEQAERRCLFHVKLTDFSMRSIESLLNSDKDACFSLWFAEGGGTISVPGSKKFNFKSSQGDNDCLECVHQALDSSKNPQLNCWGQIRYKLQVQGTEEVYKRTMNLIKVTEEQKQKSRTQTINFPHSTGKGRSKTSGHLGRPGGGRPLSKSSSPFSTPSAPPPSHSFSSSSSSSSANVSALSSGGSGGGSTSTGNFNSKFSAASGSTSGSSGTGSGPSGSGVTTGNASSHGSKGSGRKSTKPPHTLRERIVHLLAIKPHKRADIISRLKKETKRGETAMLKTDSLLTEVADLQGEMYYLKSSLYCELRVDDWPFYSDPERQLVKRKYGSGGGGGRGETDLYNDVQKRSSSRDQPAAKRQKFSHPPHSSTPPPPHSGHTQSTKKPSPPPPTAPTAPPMKSSSAPSTHFNMPQIGLGSSNLSNQSSNIEMQTTNSSSSSTNKSHTQYPEFSFSNFIRSSSGGSMSQQSTSTPPLPRTSTSSTANSSLHSTDLGTRGTAAATQQQIHQTTSATQSLPSNPQMGLSNPLAGQVGDPMQLMGDGKLFGDLLSQSATVQNEPASESTAKKKKKKKNMHKTKDRAQEKMMVDEENKEVVPEMKTKKVKKEEGEEKVDRQGSGGMAIISEPLSQVQPTALEEGGASSTTPTSLDLELKFPPISSDTVRSEYKRIFNEEYQEYLALKAEVDVVKKEVNALSDQMAAVKKGTEEAKVLKRKIRQKYTELQQNKTYQTQKRRFQELHTKLDRLKKLVVAYDQSHHL